MDEGRGRVGGRGGNAGRREGWRGKGEEGKDEEGKEGTNRQLLHQQE